MNNCEHQDTWFDRTYCSGGTMHTICNDCNEIVDGPCTCMTTMDHKQTALRTEIAEEVRAFQKTYEHTYAIPNDPYAEGYITACKSIIALLEGGVK